ncbi:DUF3822 family protein [Rhabdobacter roseus]|uniref:DUF3822 family protein n=1 Tax=Rhabdobacter roseus TaxID=1655419 RepID=A0A840TP34_9BACT|nr:DUF3822 family protein [Rhabdobacter roseus]MBB5283507.1 hypothetical protein [Rhabdobacter roseus]
MELQPTVKVADESFGIQDTSRCTLCIEIDDLRFRFCVVEEGTAHCHWLEDYASDTFMDDGEVLEKMKQIAAEHPFLSTDGWKNIRVAVNTNTFTLIPAAMFRKEYTAEYLRLALGRSVLPEDRVLYHYLPAVEAYNVFTIPTAWSEWLQEQYPLQNVAFYHLTSALITGGLASHQEYGDSRILSVYIEEDYLTLVFSKDQQLVFCNRFKYKNPGELTYLILFTLNALNYLPEEVKVYLYGEITPYAETYTELARFLPQLLFGKVPGRLHYFDQFEDIPEHRYFGLLNTYLVRS